MSNSPLERKYSKYQKVIIKELTTTLGVLPFSYEKTQNNHLKVLIDGVDMPLYTSSTPSDINSKLNFMSLVRQEVRAIHEKITTEEEGGKVKTLSAKSTKLKYNRERILIAILKSLRNILPSLENREYKLVIDASSIKPISEYRKGLIDESILRARRDQKSLSYMLIKDLNLLKKDLKMHIDFILPSIAYYSNKLNELGKTNTPKQNEKNVIVNLDTTGKKSKKQTVSLRKVPNEIKGCSEMKIEHLSNETLDIEKLSNMSSTARIASLQILSNAEGVQLITDIKKAMVLNREADLQHVRDFMAEKNITIDDIAENLPMDNLAL